MLCQIRGYSAKRLGDKYGKLNEELFKAIQKKTGKLLNLSGWEVACALRQFVRIGYGENIRSQFFVFYDSLLLQLTTLHNK